MERNFFVSPYPPNKSKTNIKFPEKGEKVFPSVFNNDTEFMHLFHAIEERDLGFFDMFWFIPDTKDGAYSLDFIKEWMDSLVYIPGEIMPQYMIVSTIESSFSRTVYINSESFVYEETSIIPIFLNENKEKFIPLGYKNFKKIIPIVFGKNTRVKALFPSGKDGVIIYDEQLQVSIDDVSHVFCGYPIELGSHQISNSLKSLLENKGFKPNNDLAKLYYVHKDTHPGSDERFWIYETDEYVFGYRRETICHIIAMIIEGHSPNVIIDTDLYKDTVVRANDAVEIIIDSGAFFSQVFQLCIALNSRLFTSDNDKFIGKTFREAMREYGYTVRIAMYDNKGLYISPKDYSSLRLNVSVADDGKIDRILGFY
jgi:hypothetical protein